MNNLPGSLRYNRANPVRNDSNSDIIFSTTAAVCKISERLAKLGKVPVNVVTKWT